MIWMYIHIFIYLYLSIYIYIYIYSYMYLSNKYIYMPPKTPMEPEEWIPGIRIFFSPSGDSWMYPYQRIPMGNPFLSPS